MMCGLRIVYVLMQFVRYYLYRRSSIQYTFIIFILEIYNLILQAYSKFISISLL
jgi:hypothetical protein